MKSDRWFAGHRYAVQVWECLDLTFLFPFRVGETFAPGSPERVEGSRDKVEIFGTFLGHSGTNRRAYMVT